MTTPPQSYYNLESERLSYRPLTADDIQTWLPFFDNNPLLRFLGMDSHYFKNLTDAEKSTEWISRQIKRKETGVYGQLAVIEKDSGKLIGLGGIIFRNEDGVYNDYEITYSLLTEFHGKGYGTELAVHFKEFALKHIDTETVISIIHQENEASMHVARKNGMVLDSSLDSYMEMPIHVFRTKK